MEINISRFFAEGNAFDFSRSIAEAGANAGPESWQNAKDEAGRAPLLETPEQLEALRDYVRGFGAWSEEEIAAWTDQECNALFIQLVSGDMREGGLDQDPDESDWGNYEERAEEGRCSGNISRGSDGEIYYSLDR